MNFVGILLAFSIVIALFGSYGATKNTKNTKDFRAKGKHRFQSPRLRFVDRKQFADLYESEAHHVLFQLQDSQTGGETARRCRHGWVLRCGNWKSVSPGYRATAGSSFAIRADSVPLC
jgi:hypothetical protein